MFHRRTMTDRTFGASPAAANQLDLSGFLPATYSLGWRRRRGRCPSRTALWSHPCPTFVSLPEPVPSPAWFPRATAQLPADEHMAHMSAGDLAAPATATASASQGDLKYPASNNNAAARLKASPRHAEWVKIAWEPGSKDSLMAWIVYPTTTRAKTPVVVVVHEIFGLSTWVRGVADQVAAEGFIAIAPDLVSRVRGGPSTDELPGDSASKLIRGVSAAERNKGIIAAASFAMAQPSADQKYGVIGYCWGGQTVFMHAINGGTNGFSRWRRVLRTPVHVPGERRVSLGSDSRLPREDHEAGDAPQRVEGRPHRRRDARGRFGDEGARQELRRARTTTAPCTDSCARRTIRRRRRIRPKKRPISRRRRTAGRGPSSS